MAEQKIPCTDCAAKKQEIEHGGTFVVLGCEPIAAEPGWCLIRYTIAPARRTNEPGGNAGNR